MERFESQFESFDQVKESLPNLPFEYEITNNKDALYNKEIRQIKGGEVDGMFFEDGKIRTDEEIKESVKMVHENSEWFYSDYWRGKGMPAEQIEFSISTKNKPIVFYNFSNEKEFSSEHMEKTEKAFREILNRFPDALNNIEWILLEDNQKQSLSGNENYPLNGFAKKNWQAIEIMPRGVDINNDHRVGEISNFEGTLTHEIGHFIQDKFLEKWKEAGFKWIDFNKEEWEKRYVNNGECQISQYINKKTGEIAPGTQYPLKPEECIDDYAKKNMEEDICDSIVAYIYNPSKLKEISSKKFEIIQFLDDSVKNKKKNIEISSKN
ncbi:MAG TPA: hypothetical protein PLD14_00665 [Candidatus Pacearchaeota archaeon]|nr:hypothetical protein [Candidatus Pacearchaeota archaeon]HPR79720.1 hypothetical protein [Candidatus Pacearchaeota archaeon]